jgi:plastocyanin
MSPRAHSADKLRVSLLPVLALIGGLLALAGCGSSSSSSTSSSTSATTSAPATTSSTASTTAPAAGGAESSLSLAADPSGQLKFDKSSLSAKAGKVSIDFTNKSPVAHNVTVESSGSVLGATPTIEGGSKSLSLTLKAGTYKFYCSVPGHRQAGMEGTLTVQ